APTGRTRYLTWRWYAGDRVAGGIVPGPEPGRALGVQQSQAIARSKVIPEVAPIGVVAGEIGRGSTAPGGARQALAPPGPGGPARIAGTYSSSWMRPSKVRLLIISSATSG